MVDSSRSQVEGGGTAAECLRPETKDSGQFAFQPQTKEAASFSRPDQPKLTFKAYADIRGLRHVWWSLTLRSRSLRDELACFGQARPSPSQLLVDSRRQIV